MQTIPLGLVGPSSHARSMAHQSARTVNLYPEMNDADAKAVVALLHAPGTFRRVDFANFYDGTLTIRGLHRMNERLFVVVNEKVLEVVEVDGVVEKGTLSTFTGRVGMSDNNGYLIIGDGTGFFAINLETVVMTQVLDENTDILRGWFSIWIDGTTLYVERDSGKYHYSDIADPLTVQGLNYMVAEGDPDPTIAAVRVGGLACILGLNSTEWHQDTGDADNPFQRIPNGLQPYGCVARWSARELGGAAIFVGKNNDGQGCVWRMTGPGAEPQQISSHAVEAALAPVLYQGLEEKVTAYTYQEEGHTFYVLNFPAAEATVNHPDQPSQTWAFDVKTGLWHERAHLNTSTGKFERVTADFHAFWRGMHMTGSYNAGHLLEMKRDYYRYDLEPSVKLRETPHIHFNGQRFSVHDIEIIMETGVGRDGGVQGADPQLMFQYSWDNMPWSNELWRPIGKIGEMNTRIRTGPCGSGRDFRLRVAISDPVRVTLISAFARVSVAGV